MSSNHLSIQQRFLERHIGHSSEDIAKMLATIEVDSLEQLINETVPANIRTAAQKPLSPFTRALSEVEAVAQLKEIINKNNIQKTMIGQGYYPNHLPSVIQRNLLENPAWYTAYTPYQSEISQGRLEALLVFQQMVVDLTGLEMANASLLDEATAAAEAMAMAKRVSKLDSMEYFVDADCFAQTIEVLKTRGHFFNFQLCIEKISKLPELLAGGKKFFGALLQTPNKIGEYCDYSTQVLELQQSGAVVAIACDLLALAIYKSPGEMGADIALGSAQRFGVPMGFGGPHAAFFAFRDSLKRNAPGRIIGVSKDSRGKTCYRMTLQTREQHIRREKANSNICTSQVLLANIAAMYALWHGRDGIESIAMRTHRLAATLALALTSHGYTLVKQNYFDTITIRSDSAIKNVAGYLFNQIDQQTISITCDETTTLSDLVNIVDGLLAVDFTGQFSRETISAAINNFYAESAQLFPAELLRKSAIFTKPIFQRYHSEHAMLRYLRTLQNRDLALDQAMIPLGSCTMKLNPTSAMLPLSWEKMANLHPFAPADDSLGYRLMIEQLGDWLCQLTGFATISWQSNSGAQGEYSGIVAIRRYQESIGQGERNICLIPKSAHGTNPATAQMCGLQIVSVECDNNGDVDINDLRDKAQLHSAQLSCLMITYPSTHGVFEEGIKEICQIVHQAGGQVYMDGANLNAQVGLTSPGAIGADVAHMNLHKTFAIPHGGGGPGMGPIGVKEHLSAYLPKHHQDHLAPQNLAAEQSSWAVSAAPYGSASILSITWMYMAMMGADGLTYATKIAILNANYIASRLRTCYPILYANQHGKVAHECIIDLRALKAASGVSEGDVAKRLMDFGFHAPTVSFPVAGTLMIEPTESESIQEIDRFCAAMLAIYEEIDQIVHGKINVEDSPLKHAPHTTADLAADTWTRKYSRQQACFPLPTIDENKYWPSVNRIDEVYGDRNICCTIP